MDLSYIDAPNDSNEILERNFSCLRSEQAVSKSNTKVGHLKQIDPKTSHNSRISVLGTFKHFICKVLFLYRNVNFEVLTVHHVLGILKVEARGKILEDGQFESPIVVSFPLHIFESIVYLGKNRTSVYVWERARERERGMEEVVLTSGVFYLSEFQQVIILRHVVSNYLRVN